MPCREKGLQPTSPTSQQSLGIIQTSPAFLLRLPYHICHLTVIGQNGQRAMGKFLPHWEMKVPARIQGPLLSRAESILLSLTPCFLLFLPSFPPLHDEQASLEGKAGDGLCNSQPVAWWLGECKEAGDTGSNPLGKESLGPVSPTP